MGDLKDGYTDDVEERYLVKLRGSKSSNINKGMNLLVYWVVVIVSDILVI